MSREPRWENYAGYVTGGDQWYDVLWRRIKTVDSYWRGTANSPTEYSAFLRILPVLKYGPTPKGAPRPKVVEAYESIVKFMLEWVQQYQSERNELRQLLDQVRRDVQYLEATLQQETERADENEKEAAALRWALELAYKARSRNDDDTT